MMNRTVKELFERKLASAHDRFVFMTDVANIDPIERDNLVFLINMDIETHMEFLKIPFNSAPIEKTINQLRMKLDLIMASQLNDPV